MFCRNPALCNTKAFQDLCDDTRAVLHTPLEDFDLSEDAAILFDNRTDDEKRKSRNAYMRELYQEFMKSNSTVEIFYKGGPAQFCKDVESGVYDN